MLGYHIGRGVWICLRRLHCPPFNAPKPIRASLAGPRRVTPDFGSSASAACILHLLPLRRGSSGGALSGVELQTRVRGWDGRLLRHGVWRDVYLEAAEPWWAGVPFSLAEEVLAL